VIIPNRHNRSAIKKSSQIPSDFKVLMVNDDKENVAAMIYYTN